MKKFLTRLKKENRGIILAVVAAVLLMGFVVYDESTFKSKEVGRLRDRVNEYITEIGRINTSDYADNSELKQLYYDVLDDFMVYPVEDASYNMMQMYYRSSTPKSRLLDNASMIDNNKGKVTKFDFKVKKIEVDKVGPGLADLNVEFSFEMESKGGMAVIPFLSGVIMMTHNDYNNRGYFADYPDYDAEVRYVGDGELQIEARKVGGEWMFYGLDGWIYRFTPTVISGDVPDDGTYSPDYYYEGYRGYW
ncbi:MAG: hypothetical protein FWF82_05245 [Oscillospiraceae bacterium]|nr:hypothetical protein [Oscillospiraceae bacterium]